MYAEFDELLTKLEKGSGTVIDYQPRDRKLIIGMLLYLVIHADGKIRDEETRYFKKLAADYLDVKRTEFPQFQASIRKLVRSQEKVDLLIREFRSASVVEKNEVLGLLHNMSISDREFHELEFNIVAKIRRLIDA